MFHSYFSKRHFESQLKKIPISFESFQFPKDQLFLNKTDDSFLKKNTCALVGNSGHLLDQNLAKNIDGIVILNNYLENLTDVRKNFDNIFNKIKDKQEVVHDKKWASFGQYSNGKAIRIYPKAYSQYTELVGLYSTPFFKNIAEAFYNGNVDFGMQYFMTHEYHVVDQNKLPRNAFLHFDPYQALKFIIYLTDTNENNGAFRYIPKTHKKGQKLREEYCQTNKGKQKAYRIDYHQEVDESELKYASAPAGSLIIFNTDTFHGGGIIKEKGLERMVLNFHCRKKEEKKPSFWQRLFN